MKLITIIGARPQFIKAAAVSRELAKPEYDVQEHIIHTGQHYDSNMSEIFFTELQIPQPHTLLKIGSGAHGAMTGQMLIELEPVILREKPDAILVYGDTNTTLAGALTAAKHHIPLVHVEAGLRSFNRHMPEEVNRVVTDQLSQLMFCPSRSSMDNLLREGRPERRIRVVGDVMHDTVLFYSKIAKPSAMITQTLQSFDGKPFFLASVHRAENTDMPEKLRDIISILTSAAENHPVLFPIHPRTIHALKSIGLSAEQLERDGIKVLPPVGYFDMLSLLKECELVITDSGGVQKEAYFMKRACITLRTETEWIELVEVGANKTVGHDPKLFMESLQHFLKNKPAFSDAVYGDGFASRQIALNICRSDWLDTKSP